VRQMAEFTLIALILGVLIGVVFGAANAYIGLRVGMTISASIPAAVISMAILRGILRRGTILENNMVQTIGSAGESLAAGMIFTIPALFIFGFKPEYLEIVLWGTIGGLLGVLFMVPLRRMLIVREHGKLPYPEGVACAEVLESGDRGGAGAKKVFWGLGVGALFELFRGLGFWGETARQRLPVAQTEVSLNAEPALLGVGYILGARISAFILAGAVLGWFVIIPAIALFGASTGIPVYPETETLISDMSPGDLWNRYLRYVGAGAVVLGGLISLIKGLRTVFGSVFQFGRPTAGVDAKGRTQRDMPWPILILGILALGVAMWYLDAVKVGHFGAIAVVVFAFFFVTVSSRLVGIVGSSSNPASGMTIATLLGTALIAVYGFGMTAEADKFIIISVGALVCIAICIAGDCSQDLKTGFLVKATPWKQQFGEVIGVLTATAVIAFVIIQLNSTYGFDKDVNPDALLAPQANIMKLLVEGIVDGNLPWALIVAGAAAALVVEMLGIPSLPFAVGLYLPLYLSTPIMAGGLLRLVIDKARKPASQAQNPGILAASGLVAGQGVMGLILAGVTAFIAWYWVNPKWVPPERELPAVVATAEAGAVDAALVEQADAGLATPPDPLPAPAVTTTAAAEEVEEELVKADDFFPWLSTRFDWLAPDYGLKPIEVDEEGPFGAFSGDYAVDLYQLLPLAPFALLVIWLAVVAAGRLPTGPAPPLVPSAAKAPPTDEEPSAEAEASADNTETPA
jgi:putative OPT family oligopeptide transporter